MKIVLSVPGYLKTVPMNQYVYQTLLSMGHEVIPHNFGRDNTREALLKSVHRAKFAHFKSQQAVRLVERVNPDVFLTIFGFNFDRPAIERIKSMGVLTVCWWLNDPFQFERSAANASAYDYYFTNARMAVDCYRRLGVKNAFHLPAGCYPPVHRKLPSLYRKHDVTFAGDWNPVRERILESLAEEFNVSVFGPWERKLGRHSVLRPLVRQSGFFSPQEMVRIFNESNVILNIHSWLGRWHYGTNPRLFEANGCGAFQVCDWKEEIPELYAEGSELILYKSVDDLRETLRHFLQKERERTEIAHRGYLRTLKEHTYEHRLTEMLRTCGLS